MKNETGKMKVVNYILAFVLPVFLLLYTFKERQIYPFGGKTFLFSDASLQYLPFIRGFADALRDGGFKSLVYRFGLGGEFSVVFMYYLTDPLSIIAGFLDGGMAIDYLTCLSVIKISLCSLTAFIYFQRIYKKSSFIPLAAGFFYAFSGFLTAYGYNTIWLNSLVLFPLVIYFFEDYLEGKGSKGFVITLSLSIFFNFYIGMIICIFLVLYFCALSFEKGKESFNIKKVLGFIKYLSFSLLINGAVLIPVAAFILGNRAVSDKDPRPVFAFFYDLFTFLSRHMVGVETNLSNGEIPDIYSGVWIFILIPLFFLADLREISARRKISHGVLLLIMILSFLTDPLYSIWHGLNYPNNLPARFGFVYVFLLLSMSVEALRTKISKNAALASFILGIGFVFTYIYKSNPVNELKNAEWFSGVFILFYCIFGVYVLYSKKIKNRRGFEFILFIALIFECGFNYYITGVRTVDREQYVNIYETGKELGNVIVSDNAARFNDSAERINDNADALNSDKGIKIQRVETFPKININSGLMYGFDSASLFSSFVSSDTVELYNRLGMPTDDVSYSFDGATPLCSLLLNVDYMVIPSGKFEGEIYENLGEVSYLSQADEPGTATGNNGTETQYVYKNRYSVPFGYVIPESALESIGVELESAGNDELDLGINDKDPVEYQNMIS
ncbi:MAG: YfhO family protein, partial [Lachnospiraceae bacterium]|nr:YfhO family protein [Lachnospiraceae bacterium]